MAAPKIDLINEIAKFRWDMYLHPASWTAYAGPAGLAWTSHALSATNTPHIPGASGIYLLVLDSGVTGYDSTYLMYVGQSGDLHGRFKQYLTSEKKGKRAKIVRLLNNHTDHVHFYFTNVPAANLDFVEDSLINAFLPPCNSDIEGVFGAARRAFQ